MRHTCILWLMILLFPAWGAAQNCGLEDTLLINANSMLTLDIDVDGYFNDDLADADQGLCGVEIEFVHAFSENLELWLTSPAGQQVQLIGPNTNDNSAFTFAALWDITFLPCAATAEPDSGYVAQWDNNQPNNFVAGGQYRGSYYPFNGCFEDLDTGPVNGAWTITINNNPSFYPGALIDFRLVFCDTRGVECCFSDAGNLIDTLDLVACEGDAGLFLAELQPVYPFFLSEPDSTEYGYTYAIGEGGILVDYDSLVDLRTFPPGNYQVCGLSYKREDLDSLRAPDGLLTLDSIRNNLDSELPWFCGELTDSCVSVTITPVPGLTTLTPGICAGDSLTVGDSVFYDAGTYVLAFESIGGCDSLVSVELTVLPVAQADLTETICEGESITVGASVYQASGLYADTLTAANGCDSIITLDLTVLPPDTVDLARTICAGDTVFVGSFPFTTTGSHQVTLLSSQGCDSTVNLQLTVLAPEAVIAAPDTITCGRPAVTLDGGASQPAGITYQWLGGGGAPLGTDPTQAVAAPGDYQLVVTSTLNGAACPDTASVSVLENTVPPVADAGPPDTLTCDRAEAFLGGPATSQGPAFTYSWTTTGGQIASPADSIAARVTAAGRYFLEVTDQDNGCTAQDSVDVAVDTEAPLADAGPDRQLDCTNDSVTLDGSASSAGPRFTYDWISASGLIPADAGTPTPIVDQPGLYRLLVTDTGNGCVDSAFAEVTLDTLAPAVFIEPPGLLNCEVTTLTLDGSASDSGPAFDLLWRVSAGGHIAAGEDSLTPVVDQPGAYELVIISLDNGCRDSTAVTVQDTLTTVIAEAGPAATLTCAATTVTLDGSASTMGPDMVYQWSIAGGNIPGDPTQPTLTVDAPGVYELIVRDTFTFCADTSTVQVDQDLTPPLAEAGPAILLDCTNTVDTLDGSASAAGPGITYAWSGPCLLSAPDAVRVLVDCPGTYFLTVTNENNGCSAVDSVLVTQDDALPTAAAGPPDTLTCATPQLTLDGTASSQGPGLAFAWTGPGILAGADTPTPLVDLPGLYTLIVTNSASTCADTAFVIIAQDTVAPVADAGAGGVLTCVVTELTLGGPSSSVGSGLVYNWTADPGNLTGPSDAPITAADAAGLYTLIVTDQNNGCADTASVSLTADQTPPVAEAGPAQTIDCAGPVVTLDGSSSTDGSEFLYEWSGPCLTGDPGQPIVTADCPGQYYLMVTDTSNGCFATDSVLVSQDEVLPLAEAGPPDTLTCAATILTLDGTASSQGAGFTYQWTGPGIAAGDTTLTPLVDAPGLYTLAVTNLANACTTVDSVLISEDVETPVADAGPPAMLNCLVDTVTLGGSGTTTGPDISYQWFSSEGDPLPPLDGPIVQAAVPGVYVLFVTNTRNGCADTSFVNVTQDLEAPSADAGSPDLISCGQPVATLDGSGSEGATALAYNWSGPCLLTDPDSMTVQVDCPGNYVLTVTNLLNGCTDTDTVAISLAPETPLALLPDTVLLSCATGTAVLDGSGSTTGPVEWLFAGQPAPLSGLSPTVSEAGTYTLIVFNLAQDCSDTAVTVVVLDCDPVLSLDTPDTLTCYQPSVILRSSVIPAGVGYSYQWTATDPGCVLGTTTADSLVVTCAGVYTLIATNPVLGLSDTASVTVAEDRLFPVADAGAPDTLICTIPSLTVGGPLTSTGPEFVYIWTNFNGDTLGFQTTLTVTEPDTYFLEVTDTTNGCASENFVVISEIVGMPDIFFGNTVFPCTADTFGLRAFLDPPDTIYQISWAGPGLVGPSDSLTLLIDTAGTYVLTVVNPINNCVSVDSVQVTEQECGPCIEIGIPDTLTCAVTTVILQADYCEPCLNCTFSWSAADGGSFLSGTDTFNPVVDAAGVYTLTATDSMGVSTARSVTVVALTDAPPADAGPDQVLTCGQLSRQLGDPTAPPAGAFSYQWSSPDGSLPAPADQPLTTVNEPGTYILRMENMLTGCFAFDTTVVTIDTMPPLAEAGPDLAITCQTSLVSPDGAGSSLGALFTYEWTTNGSGNISGSNSLNPVVDAPGTYYLEVTRADNQCTALDSMQVILDDDLPALPVIPDTVLTCADTLILLPGALPAPSGFSFSWCRVAPNGDLTGCQSDSLALAVDEPGRYRFLVTNDLTGCTNQLTVEVGQNIDPPLAGAGPNDTLLCSMPDLTLSGSAGPAGANLSVIWTAAGGSPVLNPATLTPTVLEPDTYYLVVINEDNQCAAADSVVIFRDANAPQADAGPDTLLTCTLTEIRLQGQAQTVGAAAYLWQTPDGRILADSTTAMPLVDRPGQYVLTVTDGQNGCTAVDTVLVMTDTLPPSAALADTTALLLTCALTEVSLDGSASLAAGGGTLTYEWTSGPGGQISGGDPATAYIEVSRSGSYRLVVTDAGNGCRDTLTATVGADFTPPVVAIGAPAALTCVNLETILDAAASSAGPIFENTWSGPDGNALPDTGLQPVVSRPGSYQLVILNTDNGCADTAAVVVAMDTLAPVARIAPPADLDCDVPEVTLDGSGSSQGPDLQFAWRTGDGLLLGGQSASVATAAAAGTYVLTVTNLRNGCADSTQVTVLERSVPISGVTFSVTSPSCTGETNGILRVETVSGGTPPFVYAIDEGAFITFDYFNNLAPGLHTLHVLDAAGCQLDTLFEIAAPEEVTLNLGPDTTLNLGDSLFLLAQTNVTGPAFLRWTATGSDLGLDTLGWWARPLETTTYGATVTNADGCSATDWITVTVVRPEAVYIPDAFSPDGDGQNDRFVIFAGKDVARIRSFAIFDRWGNQVFSGRDFLPNDPAFGWDGTFQGQSLNPAVFVYQAEVEFVDGRVELVYGDLVLLR